MALSKNNEKLIKSLRRKKYRQKYNIFVAEGDKIADEIIFHQANFIVKIFALPTWVTKYENKLGALSDKLVVINERELARISSLTSPNQVLLLVEMDSSKPSRELFASHVFYTDAIQDPGNMGTIIRIADWFGFDAVVTSPDSVDFYHPKVVQSAMASHIRMKLFVMDLDELREIYPVSLVGSSLQGESMYHSTISDQAIVILGNEGNGIRSDFVEKCDQLIYIDSFSDTNIDSLNVAVAAGVIASYIKGSSLANR